MAVRLATERLVGEVGVEQAEFPQLVGDVLADVGHRAVAADDDLFRLLEVLEALPRERHHPAALAVSRSHELDRPRLFQQLERPFPEMVGQDGALPGEQVVAHPDAGHRVEMTVDDAPRHVRGQIGHLAAPLLQVLQHRGPQAQRLRLPLVHLGDACIEIPAEEIEAPADRLRRRHPILQDLAEADDQVRHLDSRVVDVVLHLHLMPEESQASRQRVPQDGVAQVADVRRLVRIDVGVLEDDLAARGDRGLWREDLARQRARRSTPIEEDVQVPGPARLDPGHPRRERE